MSLQRVSYGVRRLEAWLLSWAVIAVAVLTVANVASRTLFHTSLAFAEELTQFLIVFICFIGLSYATGEGRHIRMTAVSDHLRPSRRKALAILVAATTALLMFLLAWYAVRYIRTVHFLGTVSPVLKVPLWIVYLSAPLGFTLAGVQYALAVVRNLRKEDVYLSWEKKDEYEEPAAGRI